MSAKSSSTVPPVIPTITNPKIRKYNNRRSAVGLPLEPSPTGDGCAEVGVVKKSPHLCSKYCVNLNTDPCGPIGHFAKDSSLQWSWGDEGKSVRFILNIQKIKIGAKCVGDVML